jgi:hypothetical protein
MLIFHSHKIKKIDSSFREFCVTQEGERFGGGWDVQQSKTARETGVRVKVEKTRGGREGECA